MKGSEGDGPARGAVEELFQQDDAAGEGAAVDGEDGVAVMKAGGGGGRVDEGDTGDDEAVGQMGGVGLGVGEVDAVTFATVIEGRPGALGALAEVLKVVDCAQVEVREGEEGSESEKDVLKTGALLEHGWLHGSSQPGKRCAGICGEERLFLGFAGDDLIFDFVVGGLGEDAAGDELILGGVGAAVDDAFGVGVADAVEGLELVGGGGVDVELVAGGGGSGSFGGGSGLCGRFLGDAGDGEGE